MPLTTETVTVASVKAEIETVTAEYRAKLRALRALLKVLATEEKLA